MTQFSHVDLFSGLGGFALAASWAGFETRAFCEIDPFCQKVLRKNFGDVPCFGDIRTVTAESLRGRGIERVDLLTGGFPCQPFSVAGKQDGKADDRYLWPEMRRVIHETRPTWVVGENVTGILDLALDTVLSELEAEGYEVEAVIIPACAVNAPHQRDRVWILAHTASKSSRRCACCDQNSERSHCSSFGPELFRVPTPGSSAPVADACCKGLEKREGSAGERTRAATPRSDGWSTQSPFCGVADGIPGRVDRLKGLGNAIVPQVAYEILRPIAALLGAAAVVILGVGGL